MTRLRSLPLRVRLMSGFVAAMLLLLTAAGAFVYWRVEYALDRGLDADLTQATATITPLVTSTGTVTALAAANASGAGWQVIDDSGTVVASGGPVPRRSLASAPDLRAVSSGRGSLTLQIGSLIPPPSTTPYRAHLTRLAADDGALSLLVAAPRNRRDEALRELLLQLILAGLGALVVAAAVGDRLARAALRPVERFRARAADIAGGALGVRLDVPAGRDDEVTRLGHTLNDMLAALERSLDHERRFVHDASHELRTPLTLLKSRLQLARRRPRTVAEHERVLDELEVDLSRLVCLAEDLLAVGAGQAGGTHRTQVVPVVEDVVVRHRSAGEHQLREDLVLDLPAAPLAAAIDSTVLDRVVGNVVQNAFTHGRPPVTVGVAERDGFVVLQVTDGGDGMDAGLLDRATERFTRAPEARSRPGAGLGLSLVEAAVVGAGGELRLCHAGTHTSSGVPKAPACEHGDGMTVTVLLDVAAAD